LSWSRLDGAADCIGTRELAQAVEQLLGRAVFVSAAKADVSVEGQVKRVGKVGQWEAIITMSDHQGKPLGFRELISESSTCRDLDESLALAIALMIDPDAMSKPPVPPPVTPSAKPTEPPPPKVVIEKQPVYIPVPAPPKPPEKNPWRWDLRAGPALAVGVVPDVGFTLHAGVTMQPPWPVAFEGSTTVVLPRKTEVGAASADFLMFYFSGAICPLALRGYSLTFWLCIESQFGAIHGSARDFAVNDQSTRFILNSAVRARLSYRVVGPLTLGGGVVGAVPWIRDRFVYRDGSGSVQELFRLSPILFVPELHVGLSFP